MRVLVSGGAGYIGSHTVVHLTAAGHDVLVVDNFGNAKPAVMARLDALTDTHIPVHAFDLTDRDKTEHLFATEQIDAVVHFAGLKAVGESVQLPLDYYENNLQSTFSLLRAMRRHGCSTLVFSSSATVYGDQAPAALSRGLRAAPGHQPLRADQGDDRDGAARCRAHRPLVAHRGPALLQPRRRAPVRRDRRGPAGDPQQPHAVHRAGRRGSSRPAAHLRRRLPHDRRHLRARLHPRRGPRRRPCRGAQPDRGHRRADSHLEPRDGPGHLGVGDGQGLRTRLRYADPLRHRRPPGRRPAGLRGPTRPGPTTSSAGWRPGRSTTCARTRGGGRARTRTATRTATKTATRTGCA